MELTQFTDYSLRVLIYLGRLENRTATIRELSDYYRISVNHLMKIIPHLAEKGYIQTIRGRRGGVRLAKTPDRIKIGSVIRESEKNLAVVECFRSEGTECPLFPECTLKSALQAATENFLGTLDRFYLSDLLKAPVRQSTGKKRPPIS